nr:transcriptional regulator [Fulvimarina pelagi]
MGRLRVLFDGQTIEFPASRKLRALLAYLALAENPVGRSRLCDLLGDLPSDPRGELRWYLSRLRAVLKRAGGRRVVVEEDMVSLDLTDTAVDALEIRRIMRVGVENAGIDELRRVLTLFTGEFLEGLDLKRSPQLDHWLEARRSYFRSCHAAVLAQIITRLPADDTDTRELCERWTSLAPFEMRAHLSLMASLPNVEAERHLAAAVRLFEAEDMDAAPLVLAWRRLRATPAAVAEPAAVPAAKVAPVADRASLAVMPFLEPDAVAPRTGLGAGLTRDIIVRLAKLRSIFVIAQGSVFALAERGIGAEDAGQRLNVDYVASGMVRRRAGRLSVTVELVEAQSARIIWSDEYEGAEDEAFDVLDQIGNMIVWSIASEIETAEKNRAILRPPNSLNAWEAYHRGLWHMYRFTREDNQLAHGFFQQSVATDPTFSRAHAGLSFTHWQNAFQKWQDRQSETELAYAAAQRSLLVDDHDPAAHWAMGRALWLRRDEGQAIAELERAVDLSPNFALGHYALSFVHSQSGDPMKAISSADHSQRLSPFDPLLFGMYGAKAMANVRLGRFDEAADCALRAMARPNAHIIIRQIAALCLALAGREDEARVVAANIRASLPGYRIDEFFRTFKFPPETETLFRKGATQIGLN